MLFFIHFRTYIIITITTDITGGYEEESNFAASNSWYKNAIMEFDTANVAPFTATNYYKTKVYDNRNFNKITAY